MPKTAAYTGFSSTGAYTNSYDQFNVNGSFNDGWDFYTEGWKSGSTTFFHAYGYRDTYDSRGAVVQFKHEGRYWACGASSAVNGRLLFFGSNTVRPQDQTIRSCGFGVRPVKE